MAVTLAPTDDSPSLTADLHHINEDNPYSRAPRQSRILVAAR